MDTVPTVFNIQKIRFTDKLSFKLTIKKELLLCPVLPLSILTLVENAIKHAVDAQFEPVTITLVVQIDHQELIIKVLDDGPGLGLSIDLEKQSSSLGLGLALNNIKSRLLLLFGDNSKLKLSNRDVKGVSAKINIPLSINEINGEKIYSSRLLK